MADYTTIDDPSAHFQTTLYTGNGSANHAITNGGHSDLQPDLVWIKNRDATDANVLFDSTRGATKYLSSDHYPPGEITDADTLDSFTSDGFQVDADVKVNTDTEAYVAWQWKANGGTTSSNTTGDITATVQANTTAGFSIITYTGNDTADDTIGHGLSAAPQVYWCKARTYNGGVNWISEWSVFTAGTPNLNLSRVPVTYGGDSPLMTSQATTITHTTARGETNDDQGTYVIYCWTPIQGFSKFGSYTGNGNVDGPFIYTGFKPAFVLGKSATGDKNWWIHDNKRNGFNPNNYALFANLNNATDANVRLDLLSNGFKFRDTSTHWNEASSTVIYMAFAHQPFVTSEDGGSIPCTAR